MHLYSAQTEGNIWKMEMERENMTISLKLTLNFRSQIVVCGMTFFAALLALNDNVRMVYFNITFRKDKYFFFFFSLFLSIFH